MINKYNYIYVLQANYGKGWEDLIAEDKTFVGLKAIKKTRQEYSDNENGAYRIIKRREKKVFVK